MTDLVEKVAKAMCAHEWRRCGASDALVERKVAEEWFEFKPKANTAIRAVAEWLAETEERECYPLETLHSELEQQRKETT